MFQSAPCTKVQGGSSTHDLFNKTPHLHPCFNPLPAPKYREMRAAHNGRRHAHTRCFNPLPAPKYREMQFGDDILRMGMTSWLFQSAPCTKVQGDSSISTAPVQCMAYRVSIRSLHQSTGRSLEGPASTAVSSLVSFQSAPCTKVQGDSQRFLSGTWSHVR